MPGKVTVTYSDEIKNQINMPVGDDSSLFLASYKALMPEVNLESERSGPGQIFDENRFDQVEVTTQLPFVIDAHYDMISLSEDLDQQAMLEDFKQLIPECEQRFVQKTGPGDEQLIDYAYASVFNPAKRALNGWPVFKLNERLNLSAWRKEFGAYINLGSDDVTRKQLAWCDEHFPLPRMVIDIDHAIQIHVDYFDEAEKGTLTPEKEAEYRQRLLERETRILSSLERVAGVTDREEGLRIQELTGIGNGAHNFNRRAGRGLMMTYADTEARITGLKNGWPIEDLNALSTYKYRMERIYTMAYYTDDLNLQMRDKPVFKPGEQDFLTRMQQLWAKIESTPVKNNDTRKALLTEMRTLIQEGVDKEFVPTLTLTEAEPAFSYDLYDIDRKLARQLTPSEQTAMEQGEAYDQQSLASFTRMDTNAEQLRNEDYRRAREAERRRQEEEQLKQEEEQRRQEAAVKEAEDLERDREAGNLIDVIFENVLEVAEVGRPVAQRDYNEVIQEARERRKAGPSQEELEKRRLDDNLKGDIWFYSALKNKRQAAVANTPISISGRPSSDQDDLLRHYMGKSDAGFTDALNLKLLPMEERRQIAEEYYDNLIAHPFWNVPEPEAVKNARYFGELDARAARNIAARPLPAFDPRDPEQVKNIANSELGLLASFTVDFFQDDKNLRNKNDPSSPLRAAYVSGFGTREDYARLFGQLSFGEALVSLAGAVNTSQMGPLRRSIALHFMQKYCDEVKGKPLSSVSADKWMEVSAVSSGLWKTMHEPERLPLEGAPTQEQLDAFLAGGPSPFTAEYLAKLDPLIFEFKQLVPQGESENHVRKVQNGTVDMARIYNLDFISINGTPRNRLDLDQLTGMSDELKTKTHQIFDQTLGYLVDVSSMQPALASARGESALDRFSVNGRKISALMDEFYGKDQMALMSPTDREIAMEAILLQAIADPQYTITYTPLNYDPDGSIVEQQPVTIPRPVPQRAAEVPVQPADDEMRFEHQVARAEQHAQKLDSFVPGAYEVFGEGHLVGKLLVHAHAPEQVANIKRSFMEEYAQSADSLADAVAAEKPQMAAYLRLQANIAKRSIERPIPVPAYPFNTLMGLVDQIHLPLPNVIDEKKPGPVFRLIADQPDGFNPFPVLEAAQSAERLMNLTAAHSGRLRDAEHPATAEEDKAARLQIFDEITTLEGYLDEMERVAGIRRRSRQLTEAFDDPEVIGRFMNGNPGLAAMRAELSGRRTALTKGWPVEDVDLIAGFYAKREVVWQAIRNLPEGSDSRLVYERAGRVLEEICDRINNTTITNSEERTRLLESINSYGDALYNNTISRAGAPEQGQTQALKNAMTKAMQAQIPAAAFRTAEESAAIEEQAETHFKDARKRAEEAETARRTRVADARRAKREAQKKQEPKPDRSEREEVRDFIDGLIGDMERENAEEFAAEADEQAGWSAEFLTGEEVREQRRQRRAYNDRYNDPNDMHYQTFDENFAGEDVRAVSGFAINDDYLRMLGEDENFFGNLFKESYSSKANFDLYGHENVAGFFEWQDIRERLGVICKGPCKDLRLKDDRMPSFTNDFRAWAMVEKGLTFREALELNTAGLVERRKLATEYLDVLEDHPLNKNMTDSEREMSATYYAYLHKSAMDKFLETDFPELDLSSEDAIRRIAAGPSEMHAMSQFALDLNQDTEKLYMSTDPVVRSAYLRGMGGREICTGSFEKVYLAQSIETMARPITEPLSPYCPLRNKAYAKLQLERVNAAMRGKKLADVTPGYADYLSRMANELIYKPIQAEGAPSDQELRDYLDGKIPSPFTENYLQAVDGAMDRFLSEDNIRHVRGEVAKGLETAKGSLKKMADVYNLPYVPMGPSAERVQPDYMTMSDGVLRDTDVAFDRIFGDLLNSQTNMQVQFSSMRGETLTDRFRIDGHRVSELPGLQAAKENRTPEDFQIICEAEILRAIADPARNVTYVPVALGENHTIVEVDPVAIRRPAPEAFPAEEANLDPAVTGSDDTRRIMKYTMGYFKAPVDLTDYQGLYDGDPLLDPFKHGEKLQDPMFYSIGEEEEGEMNHAVGVYRGINNTDGDIVSYRMLHGTLKDGTLTEEGKRNLKKLTEQMNALYDRIDETAAEWDVKDPMLAEMFRYKKDVVATEERGTPWTDLKDDYTYMNMGSQVGKLHIAPPGDSIPYDQTQAMHAIQGYPTGTPRYTLPQAIAATMRMVHSEAAQIRSQREGTLTRQQDRMNRRLLLTEIEEIEKQLRRMDALYLSSVDENGKPDPSKPGLAHVAYLNQFLENPVFEASSYHPRGTRLVHVDLDTKRRLLAQGWPVEDLSGLSRFYLNREELRRYLDNPENVKKLTPEKHMQMERAWKVLDEVCGYLDRKEIRNAADRDQALDHIIGYGALLFNDTVFDSSEIRDAMQKKIAEARARRPLEEEFLTDQERNEYKESFAAYQAQAGQAELKPTMNAPLTEEERAFLNATHLSRLYEVSGQLMKDPAVDADPELAQARHEVQLYCAQVEKFYRTKEFLDPEKADDRRRAFEELMQRSTKLVSALDTAEEKLTKNGTKTQFKPEEEKTLREFRQAGHAISEMRRMSIAQSEYEQKRNEDLMAIERAEVERAQTEAEETLEAQRRMVPLDSVLSGLSQEDQERLIHLLTDPIPGTDHFDFETGQVIPAQPRELPQRIRMVDDGDGNLVPEAFVVADRQAQWAAGEEEAERARQQEEAAQRTPEAIRRYARRNRRMDREALAMVGISPYDQGAEDLFAMADQDYSVAEVERRQRERNEEGQRRRALKESTGDERYGWSFSHILQDAYERSQNAAAANERISQDPAASQAEVTNAQLAEWDSNDIYSRMTKAVVAAHGPRFIEERIKQIRPEWYEQTLLPAVESALQELPAQYREQPSARFKLISRVLLQEVSLEDRHSLLQALADALPVSQREELRTTLITMEAPVKRPYNDQVTRPLAEQIDKLLTAEMPENEYTVDEIQEYHQILNNAKETLDEVRREVFEYAKQRAYDYEGAQKTVREHRIDAFLESSDDNTRIIAGQMRKGDDRLVTDGVLPVHSETLERLMHPTTQYGQAYKDAVAHMLLRMEEMGIAPTDRTEQGDKELAFSELVKAKARFKEAIQDGDPESIIETGRAYEEKRKNLRELMDYAKAHFSKSSAPTNVDSTRNENVPWEFAGDYYASSQLNGVYQLYSTLKQNGMSAQEFLSDPEAARRKIYKKINEDHSLKKRMEGKRAGRILGELMAENDTELQARKASAHWATVMVNRGIEALTENDPDSAERDKNRVSNFLTTSYQGSVNSVRETSRNPFLIENPARQKDVMHLLSVVSEEDLAANTDQLLSGECFDELGHRIPIITAEQYVAQAQNIDYRKLADRSADIICEASAVNGTQFDAAAFMEEHQKALSMLLKARAADAGKPGFDMLEYELTHAAQVYDMLRAANPQRNLPALTPAQRRSMDAVAKQYETDRKRIHQTFSARQKNAIARRRRNVGNIGAQVRTAVTQRETRRNRREERIRLQEENARRQAETARLQEEERRQARERFRAEQVQLIIAQQRNDEAERRRMEHQTLPLTERLVLRDVEKAEADRAKKGVNGQLQDPGATRDASLAALDAGRRMNALLQGVVASISRDGMSHLTNARLTELLTQEFGADRANALAAKLPRGIRNADDLTDLTGEERTEVFATLAGALTPEQREMFIRLDDGFVSVHDMELVGSPYDNEMDPEQRERIRQVFDAQLTEGETSRLVRYFKGDVYNNGKETHRERMKFVAVLDEADRLLKPVDPKIKSTVEEVFNIRQKYAEAQQKRLIAARAQHPDNGYMRNLTEKRGQYRIADAEKTGEIRTLKAQKFSFDPEYIAHVTAMLKKMEEMKLLTGNVAAEEESKVYAFRPIREAQKELKEAIRAKDRERTLAAMEQLKAARRDMDELMKTAQEHFHPTEYMTNLDVLRNSSIPWDYARNGVACSQINSMYLLGNALKAHGISIDAFAADPGEAIRQMERQTQERYCTLQSFAANKTPGVLAANAATNVISNAVSGEALYASTLYERAVGGLILAEPETNQSRRAQNLLINSKILEVNSTNANFRQMKSLDTLRNGIREKSAAGREAFRALMVVDPQDMDADRMFTDPAIAADGTRMEPFSLAGYLREKNPMNYQAQAGRMETMLKDAATEVARLKAIAAEANRKNTGDASISEFSSRGFSPYQMLKARQEALTELLVLRSHEKDQPGYQALAQELRELPERYERLRQAESALNLPALTKQEKNALKAGAKEFDRLTNDRTKLINAEETRIQKEERAKERSFMQALANKDREMKRHLDRMSQLIESWASIDEIEAEETAYNNARDEKERLISARGQTLENDYKEGKLPESYATARMNQLADMIRGGAPVEAPPLFGTAQANAQAEQRRQKERETFLVETLMENRGFRMRPKRTEVPEGMRESLHRLSAPWALEIIQERRRDMGGSQAQAIPVGREAQLDALLDDGDDAQIEVNEAPHEEAPNLNGNEEPQQDVPHQNVNEVPQQDVPNQNVNEVPQQEIPNQNVNEVPQQDVPEGQEPPRQRGQARAPKVQDKSFAELAKQFDSKVQQDNHRRNSVAGIPHQTIAENGGRVNGQPDNGQPLQGPAK